jgi:hypothetical protein
VPTLTPTPTAIPVTPIPTPTSTPTPPSTENFGKIFVATNGSDLNPGTQELPYRTIQKAVSVANAGNIIIVNPGIYNEQVNITRSGNLNGGKIVIRGYTGSGCPTTSSQDINSRGLRPNPSVLMKGFSVNASYIKIECFKIISGGTSFDIPLNVSDIDMVDNVVDASQTLGSPWTGLNMTASSLVNMAKNINFSRNYILNTTYGMYIFCQTNCLFEDNEVFQLKGKNPGDDNDYTRVFGENIILRHNYFHGNSIADCVGDCHIDCFQTWNLGQNFSIARNVTIDSNMCFNAHQGIILRDVSSQSSDPASFISHKNWTVTNNIFHQGPTGSSMPWCALFEHASNVYAYNNLCMYSVWGYTGGTHAFHKNNIHFGSGYLPYGTPNGSTPGVIDSSSNNLLYESGRSYSSQYFPNDLINVDPQFVDLILNNFRLKSTSPGIDAGSTVSVNRDLSGTIRPQGSAWDIGAYEYTGNPASTPTPTPAVTTILTIMLKGCSHIAIITNTNRNINIITIISSVDYLYWPILTKLIINSSPTKISIIFTTITSPTHAIKWHNRHQLFRRT